MGHSFISRSKHCTEQVKRSFTCCRQVKPRGSSHYQSPRRQLLFHKLLHIPKPGEDGAAPQGAPVVLWGGASADFATQRKDWTSLGKGGVQKVQRPTSNPHLQAIILDVSVPHFKRPGFPHQGPGLCLTDLPWLSTATSPELQDAHRELFSRRVGRVRHSSAGDKAPL